MRPNARPFALLLVGLFLSITLVGVLIAEETDPAHRRLLKKFDEALVGLRENITCPACLGSGLNQAPTPDYRVRRGESRTRMIACGTCLGTGLADRGGLKRRARILAAYLRTLYPDVIDRERARAAALAVFNAHALLVQDDVIEQLRRRLEKNRLWTLDVRENAVSASVQSVRLDAVIPLRRLERDLIRSAKALPVPPLFEDTEPVDLPGEVVFDAFNLRTLESSTRSLRAAIVAYLRWYHTPEELKAPASQPAEPPEPDGTPEVPDETPETPEAPE